MQYNDITLAALGIVGILLHSLTKVTQLKKQGRKFTGKEYLGKEWPTMVSSFLIIIVALICKNEIKELKVAGGYLGLGFVTLGFMGQSIFATFISKVQDKIGIKEDTTDTPPAKKD